MTIISNRYDVDIDFAPATDGCHDITKRASSPVIYWYPPKVKGSPVAAMFSIALSVAIVLHVAMCGGTKVRDFHMPKEMVSSGVKKTSNAPKSLSKSMCHGPVSLNQNVNKNLQGKYEGCPCIPILNLHTYKVHPDHSDTQDRCVQVLVKRYENPPPLFWPEHSSFDWEATGGK